MDTAISDFILYGVISLVIGISLLMGMVFELSQTIPRKWILGIALGTGIIAFAIKLIMVIAFSNYGDIFFNLFEREYKAELLPTLHSSSQAINLQRQAYRWQALPKVAPVPEDNPMTVDKIHLGRKLFFDKRLSKDNSIACASCHELSNSKGGADGLAVSAGIHGLSGTRNAPTVFNAAFQKVLFWDGRAASLEQQSKGPIINPLEMGMPSYAVLEKKISAIPEYQGYFNKVFGTEPSITIDNIAKAIAAYERTLITPDSAYDRFVRVDKEALSKKQLRGMALFESKGCIFCHSGPNFSTASTFENKHAWRAFPALRDNPYENKYALTADRGVNSNSTDSDRGIWRVPSLRNVARTAPYFHNGSVSSLHEAVRIMATVQLGRSLNSEQAEIKWLATDRQLTVSKASAISDEEVDDIVAFLESLNGEINEELL